MKRVILCEGKTDAILIGYFLIKRFGWIYIKNPEKADLPVLPFDRDNEVLNWYRHPAKPNQELAIWGAGGINEIPAKLWHVIHRTKIETTSVNRFTHVVVFFDRNNRSATECRSLAKKWVSHSELEIIGDMHLGQWSKARIDLLHKTPREYHELSILSIALPPDSEGNLEIFLTNGIRNQSEHDQQLVNEAWKFIDSIPNKPYLSKTRYRHKARLGAILSVMSPDWVFSKYDRRLTQIKWEEIKSVESVYEKLSEL
jgi:hypothetical protein